MEERSIGELRKVAERYKGKYPCYFNVVVPDKEKPLILQSMKLDVGLSDQFIAEVEQILGPNSVRISM